MASAVSACLDALYRTPDAVVLVGTGAQAAGARRCLVDVFRIGRSALSGLSSWDVPLDRRHYIVCATPPADAMSTLRQRGVSEMAIVAWTELAAALGTDPVGMYRQYFGLELPDPEGTAPRPPAPRDGRPEMMSAYEMLFDTMGVVELSWTDASLAALTDVSASYLDLHRATVEGQPPLRRLLFPSPGRCGGVSLTTALSEHPAITLRVDHEGTITHIYRLLVLQRQGRVGEAALAAVLVRMLKRAECLGGNPFCFLMPYVRLAAGFECHVLKVERDRRELRESIVLRNFHYTPADFVVDRITGAQWGDMAAEAWEHLSLEQKVDWYAATVDATIERGLPAAATVVRTSLSDLDEALNRTLDHLGWPRLSRVPHLNTLPKDRIYTHDERIAMYTRQHTERGVRD